MKKIAFLALMPFLMLASCKSHYEVASVQRSRILVDARYDAQPDAQAAEFLKPYKHIVDSALKEHCPTYWLTSWCGLLRIIMRSPTSVFTTWVVFVLIYPKAM